MPKLSKETIKKRFLCPHCGQTLRTRQGLSGHVQFKHPSGAPAKENNFMQVVLDGNKIQQRAEIAGFNKEEISQMGQMLARWGLIKAVFEDEHTKFNDTDFKTHLIVSMAQMQANQQLFNKLLKELDTAISGMLTIQSNIDSIILEKSLQLKTPK